MKSKFLFSVLAMWSYWTVLMTFFGVNYYLSGLHSYAKGDAPPFPMWATITIIVLVFFSELAIYRHYKTKKLGISEDQLQSLTQKTDLDKRKRPIVITVICILSFIGVHLAIPIILIFGIYISPVFSVLIGLLTIIGLVCTVGIWKMKKWGAYLYVGLFVLNQIVGISIGTWDFGTFIAPAIPMLIVLFHFKKMD